jgi:predicted NAD/FAD-binding protein
VTLNRTRDIRPERVLGRWTYHHPVYSERAFAAQVRVAEIDGWNRTSFCGAWRGWGFHEDGARSGMEAIARAREIWTNEERPLRGPRATPAA